MIANLFKSVVGFFSKPAPQEALKTGMHLFRKHPIKHANPAVKGAFKLGVATMKKFGNKIPRL